MLSRTEQEYRTGRRWYQEPLRRSRSATIVAASFMGWASRVGSIEPDKFGDIIAVEDDPLQDISATHRVQLCRS